MLNFQNLHKINFSKYETSDSEHERIKTWVLNEAKNKDVNQFVENSSNFSESLAKQELAEDDKKRFRMVTGKKERFQAGSEILISYGNYSNRNLLLSYGFSNRINKYNYARIKLPLRTLISENQVQKLNDTYNSETLVAFKLKKTKICECLTNVLRSLA